MILEFRCKNYKSIKDEVILSMLATREESFEDSLIKIDNKRVLPAISIYGGNGSGKTNVINAIGYVSFIIRNSNRFEPNSTIPVFPHKLNSDENSSFMVQFISNNVRFAYGFELNKKEIVEEYLYHFKNNRQAIIFERSNSEYNFGRAYQKELSEIEKKMGKNNKLFLPIAAIWGKFNDIISAFEYLNNDIIINQSIQDEGWRKYTIETIAENINNKQIFIRFLNRLGIEVDDISAKIEKKEINYEDLPIRLPEEAKMFFVGGEEIKHEVKLKYKNIEIDLAEESRGVQKLFEIGGPLLDVISNGKTLVYDELETSLHPFVAEAIVSMFKDKEINDKNAQLIFTTHDTNLLDLNIFRKDEIWFVEKNKENFSSTLYSLADLKNVRKDENIEAGYIKGKYGAIPFIGNFELKKWIGVSYDSRE